MEASATLSNPDSICGRYEVEIKWNGKHTLIVKPHYLEWKSQKIFDTETSLGEGNKVEFRVFVPGQTTEWLENVVGLFESFSIHFDRSGSFRGTFQRQGEGGLECSGERAVSLEEQAAAMPTLERQLSSQDSSCSVCYDAWSETSAAVETLCGHRFCIGCVVSCCRINPPNTKGVCPMCRAEIDVKDLKRVEFT
ncbi:hypothetical protein TrRE_jg4720 [Triparma retinervis]|uniref:RING-type domain-containing protein n=1 Tax=Triparma retinervis TaxID=2557542 RepID=A0A9W7DPT9_9STRA|nr:hypothetical protein TrRE_jg4720 [Triparma retinervis]